MSLPSITNQPYAGYQTEIYQKGLQSVHPIASTDAEALESKAREVLDSTAYYYVTGSASSGSTCQSNLRAFQRWALVPRMLRGVSTKTVDISVNLFGKKYPSPLIVAPVGVQSIINDAHAECATARAAHDVGVPFTMSTAASRSIEEVGKENGGGARWFQLYWPSDDDVTASLLSRAEKAGFEVLVVTLDTFQLGWRPKDLDSAYVPFLQGIGNAVGFSDPVFIKKNLDGKSPLGPDAKPQDVLQASVKWLEQVSGGTSRSWDDLKILRKLWKGPIVLKGIQHVQDAVMAAEAGMDGIVVSNHGGRQVDGAIASLNCLPPIVDAVSSRLTVLFDSGIRTGADIQKALALGAKGVMVGRPVMWGLAVDGEDGVKAVLRGLLADLELNLTLSGLRTVSELGKDVLVRQEL